MTDMSSTEFFQLLSIIVGFGGTMLIFGLNGARQRKVMKLETYFKLESESSRLFEIARTNPEMMLYLDGRYKPKSKAEKDKLEFELRWFLPQVLNTFELSISYKEQQIFDESVFLTWVSWYHELSTAANFGLFWPDLREHYMPELRTFMDLGLEVQAELDSHRAGENEGRNLYFCKLSARLNDPQYKQYFDDCQVPQ